MRMRKMRNLEPRMERCAAYRIAEPASLKGNWRSLKPITKDIANGRMLTCLSFPMNGSMKYPQEHESSSVS